MPQARHLNGTFYNWRSKYAGLEVNEAKRLRELESENNKLKKLLAEKLLENEALKDVVSKSGNPCQQKLAVRHLIDAFRLSERLVCRLLGLTVFVNNDVRFLHAARLSL